MPYIPGQASLPRTTRKRNWEYRNMPAIYMPLNIRRDLDTTELYIKTPQEMSRLEIQELERELRSLDDPVEFESGVGLTEGDDISDRTELVKHLPEF